MQLPGLSCERRVVSCGEGDVAAGGVDGEEADPVEFAYCLWAVRCWVSMSGSRISAVLRVW
jgi:hypothetical protein